MKIVTPLAAYYLAFFATVVLSGMLLHSFNVIGSTAENALELVLIGAFIQTCTLAEFLADFLPHKHALVEFFGSRLKAQIALGFFSGVLNCLLVFCLIDGVLSIFLKTTYPAIIGMLVIFFCTPCVAGFIVLKIGRAIFR